MWVWVVWKLLLILQLNVVYLILDNKQMLFQPSLDTGHGCWVLPFHPTELNLPQQVLTTLSNSGNLNRGHVSTLSLIILTRYRQTKPFINFSITIRSVGKNFFFPQWSGNFNKKGKYCVISTWVLLLAVSTIISSENFRVSRILIPVEDLKEIIES